MSRPRAPRWVGEYVVWWGGTDWEFVNCARCGAPLLSEASKLRGYGSGCAEYATPELVRAVLRGERHACAAALGLPSAGLPPGRAKRRESRRGGGRKRSLKPPSLEQLSYLGSLAEKHGVSAEYADPRTAYDASVRISLLLARGTSPVR